MSVARIVARAVVAGCVVASAVGGCGFQGLNSYMNSNPFEANLPWM